MTVSSVTSATQAADATTTKRKTSLNQEDFMNLFITQLQNQNPLEPMDNYQMATQMAQFSSLEALSSINENLQNLTSYQASMNSLQATGLIGKKIEASGNRLSVSDGTVSEGYYKLSNTGKVTINIYDANKKLVRVIEEGTKNTSKQTLTWDGKDQSGNAVADGTYTFEVTATDDQGQSIDASTWVLNTITGISFENGITYLNTKSGKITLSDIVAVVS